MAPRGKAPRGRRTLNLNGDWRDAVDARSGYGGVATHLSDMLRIGTCSLHVAKRNAGLTGAGRSGFRLFSIRATLAVPSAAVKPVDELEVKVMRKIAVSLVVLAYIPVSIANAELKSGEPPEVCSYMKELGLATRGWRAYYENAFACSSPYKELGSEFPLANNLAYYAEGDRAAVTQVRLVLNVSNRKLANAAHDELLKAAEALSIKATGEKLPQALKDAIKAGKQETAKIGSASVDVVRENWPSHKGYDIKIMIK